MPRISLGGPSEILSGKRPLRKYLTAICQAQLEMAVRVLAYLPTLPGRSFTRMNFGQYSRASAATCQKSKELAT
jgi:hypothetical protein